MVPLSMSSFYTLTPCHFAMPMIVVTGSKYRWSRKRESINHLYPAIWCLSFFLFSFVSLSLSLSLLLSLTSSQTSAQVSLDTIRHVTKYSLFVSTCVRVNGSCSANYGKKVTNDADRTFVSNAYISKKSAKKENNKDRRARGIRKKWIEVEHGQKRRWTKWKKVVHHEVLLCSLCKGKVQFGLCSLELCYWSSSDQLALFLFLSLSLSLSQSTSWEFS